MRLHALLLAFASLLAAGCSTFDASVEKSADLRSFHRYFVQGNTNDDHKIASMIAAALVAHGLEATHGPLTMCPETAQVIVSFEDHWTWDFKNHMTALRVVMRAASNDKPLAAANYQGAAAMSAKPGEVVAQLIDQILKAPAHLPP